MSSPTTPNLVVRLLRLPWVAFLALVGVWVILALYLSFRWWMIPFAFAIVAGYGYLSWTRRSRREG
ncbi:MAG TPA: hypothetical protein VJU01_05105 [Gaiellaceae bacterium]|nr:hypothetical protein [Gaiellaceae bacterium]